MRLLRDIADRRTGFHASMLSREREILAVDNDGCCWLHSSRAVGAFPCYSGLTPACFAILAYFSIEDLR